MKDDDQTDQQEYLGDKAEKAIKKIGGDKVSKQYERITKRKCNCGGRKRKLNQLHKSYLERRRATRRQRQPESDQQNNKQ